MRPLAGIVAAVAAVWAWGAPAQSEPTPIISTIAGTGVPGYSGDGGPATEARIGAVRSMTVDTAGNVVFVDGTRIRRIDTSGTITTVAGEGTGVELAGPQRATVDAAGNVYVLDVAVVPDPDQGQRIDGRIVKVDPNGGSTTIASGGPLSRSISGSASDRAASLYWVDGNETDSGYKVDTAGSLTVFSDLWLGGLCSTGCSSLAVDGAGNLYLHKPGGPRVSRIAPDGTGAIVLIDGENPELPQPADVGNLDTMVADDPGNLYFSDVVNRVRRFGPDSSITIVAGNGTTGFGGDGGPAVDASLDRPTALATDVDGNLYIVDAGNSRIRKVTASSPQPTCNGLAATIVGTDHGETLVGTRDDDVILALGGDDKVRGGRGNDVICGGEGNDRLLGGLGNDRLFGEGGRDRLIGGPGHDVLVP